MPNENWIEVRLLVPHSLQEEASLYLAQVSGHPVIIEAGFVLRAKRPTTLLWGWEF